MATGTQISAEPTAGSSERKAIRVPQSTAPCTPSTPRMKPPRAPCTTATMMLPLTVARTTAVNLAIRLRLCMSLSGMALRISATSCEPSRSRKNSR